MRKSILGAAAVAVILTVMLGCVTTGEIPVELDESETIYISPANSDGVQDSVSYPLSVDVLERTSLTRYAMTVTDTNGAAVRTDRIDCSADGLLARIRGAATQPPEVVLWDGRNDDGDFVPDGEYRVIVQVWDNRDNTGSGAEQRVVVDNTPPVVAVSAPSLLFTPNGDDQLEELAVYQRESSVEDRWVGTIMVAEGSSLREYVWTGGAADFVWDGNTGDGTPAPEGLYTYSVGTTDRAGNTAVFRLTGIQLERDPRPVSLFISRTAFSPNRDGSADTLTLHASIPILTNLERWDLEVRTEAGRLVRAFSGTGEPPEIDFDGLGDDGKPVEDGRYRAVLKATYAGGQEPETASPVFTIDTDPPRSTVAVSSLVFSPDGDDRMDTIEILQSSSVERRWTGTFRRANGSAVRSASWTDQVSNFVWDGTDAAGQVLPDGMYTYDLCAMDDGGNTAVPAIARFRIDTRPVSVRILRSDARISPNADGVLDSMTLSVIAEVTEGIERWVVTLSDARGTALGELTEGTTLPQSFEWNGLLGGRPLDDGIYYPEVEVHYESGAISTALGSSVLVDTTGPEIGLDFRPAYFSPDGDGNDDELIISISAIDPSSIDRWSASILDPTGQLFAEWGGTGRPPIVIRWDGISLSGELVEAAEDYQVTVTATDTVGNTGSGETVVPIDILVTREGDRLRLSSIYFEPNTSGFENLDDPELAQRNLETLDRLARVLERYPQYKIRIEGHATHLLSFDPLRAQTEHFEVLVPLSFARAEAIRQALVRRGISRSRMTIFGHGGIRPVVPHTDELNRWKNRRVEFILERR